MGNAIRHEGRQIVKGVAEANVVAGDRTTIEDVTGIVIEGGDTGETIEIVVGFGLTLGMPRANAAVTAGKRAYLTSGDQVTETSTSNTLIGIFAETGLAVANEDTPVCLLSEFDGNILANMATPAGTGITGGTGTSCISSVEKIGALYKTTIVIDLTGLHSTAADDIIGVDGTANPCHIGQIVAAVSGTIFAGKITCLEAPAGGDPDIDLYSAVESTGTEDTAISTLDETQLIDAGDHVANAYKSLTAYPAADEYLYLVAGVTTDADYTAGILVIVLWGQ